MVPELTYALRLVDGGLPHGFLDDVKQACEESGYKLVSYATWFDSGRESWMVTFKLELINEDRPRL